MLSILRTVSVLLSSENLKSLYRFLAEEATMGSNKYDAVKAEKDVAMRRFKWLFEACAVLFVLAQCSSLWLPIAADLLRETVAIFRSHLFVFALFNSILLAVYALSARIPRPNDAASEPNDDDEDLYGQFVTNSKRIAAAADESPPPGTEKTATPDNVGDSVTVRNLTAAEPKENHNSVCTDDEKALVVRSTRSASFGARSSVSDESRREFRRSYTEVRRRLTSCGEEEAMRLSRSSAVNGMSESDEEFHRRIDNFIAAQKWIQQEEYKEERRTERFVALAVCQ